MDYAKLVKLFVDKLEFFVHIISIVIVIRGIIEALYTVIKDYKNIESTFVQARIMLCESISLALSFVLSIEVIKIMYITNMQQLGLVFMIILLKILIHYFVDQDLEKYKDQMSI